MAYVREYPHKIWPYMVQYLHFRILKFPLIKDEHDEKMTDKYRNIPGRGLENDGNMMVK